MKFIFMILLPLGLIILASIGGTQYYNFTYDMQQLENDKLDLLCKDIVYIDDEDILIAKRKITEAITAKGYSIAEDGFEFRAYHPGMISKSSSHVWQISSDKVSQPELHIFITAETTILNVTVTANIEYIKNIKRY